MRQIGLAVLQFCDGRKGEFPEWYHATHNGSAAGTYSWIYTISPHMESVDAIRICPEDFLLPERDMVKGTSYVVSDYLAADGVPGRVRNINKLQATSKTFAVFEAADKRECNPLTYREDKRLEYADPKNDHAHCSNWFSQYNLDNSVLNNNLVAKAVKADIQLDRHAATSHYLYVDGHVDVIAAPEIEDWIAAGTNFAQPE
jgi:prepilin-type processing-associated H-X9-DG protein